MIAGAACSLLLFLPPVQIFFLFILEKLKGSGLRNPELWKGRIRITACLAAAACAIASSIILAQKKHRKSIIYASCLLFGLISCLLFPLSCRISFLQFFCGKTPEEAQDRIRTTSLLYKSLFCSAGFFSLAFITKNFSFDKEMLKDKLLNKLSQMPIALEKQEKKLLIIQ